MKHLVIFLNYCRSRLDNPVYRLFLTESIYRRNATLLYLPKPLEERELNHEVSELRKKQNSEEDVTFHICADMLRDNEGVHIINTVTLIRRTFPSSTITRYPIFVYGQMPNPLDVDPEVRKCIWNNLVAINNAASDRIECRLIQTVYLYNDQSQKSLASFIFNICHSNIGFEKLSVRLNVKQRDLFEDPETDFSSIDFPPIFGGFNASGVSYPEFEIRSYLRHYFLYSALCYVLPSVNEVNPDVCNNETKRILSDLPLSISLICKQDEVFWSDIMSLQPKALSDIPHSEWFKHIRDAAEDVFNKSYHGVGVENFFAIEDKKISQYCFEMISVIEREFDKSFIYYPYTPDALKTIVRSLVNILQQKAIEIQNCKEKAIQDITKLEKTIAVKIEKWETFGFLKRLFGKTNQELEAYVNDIIALMNQRTMVHGCDFAVKLLNELIPTVSSLVERCDNYNVIFNEALSRVESIVKDNRDSIDFGFFGKEDFERTLAAIAADNEALKMLYQRMFNDVYSSQGSISNGDLLLSSVREYIADVVDKYIEDKIDNCIIPPVLGMPVSERITRNTSAIGGMIGFIEGLDRNSPVTLKLKEGVEVQEKSILIAPMLEDTPSNVDYILSDDDSRIDLIHIKYGVTLQDLDGFAGQRMFIEPSIF